MAQLDQAKLRALSYVAELRETSEIRQLFVEVLIKRNGQLKGALGYDVELQERLSAATRLKATPQAAMYRGLLVQANSVFEAYIRDLSAIVAELRASRVERYSNLPESFRHQHIYYSSQVLQHMKTGTLAGQKYDFLRLTKALGQCFSDTSPFSIAPEVFTLMMGNVTPDRLEKLFEKIDLPNPFDPGVGGHAAIRRILGESRSSVAGKLAREKLLELIAVRNTLVHGDLSVTVEKSDFDEAIGFLEAMIESLNDLVVNAIS